MDNSDFEYLEAARNLSASSSAEQPVVSDSLSLFKALQVRHEPLEPARARQRAQQLQEIYAEDDEAQLVCYRHAEVVVFMATVGSLLLLVVSIALTCCWRVRKLIRHESPGASSKSLPSSRDWLGGAAAAPFAPACNFSAFSSASSAPSSPSACSSGLSPSPSLASGAAAATTKEQQIYGLPASSLSLLANLLAPQQRRQASARPTLVAPNSWRPSLQGGSG